MRFRSRRTRFSRRRIPFRRRTHARSSFKKSFAGRKRSHAYTAFTGALSQLKYSSHKLGIRRWRNQLWRQTTYKPHYRSIFNGSQSASTGATQGTSPPLLILPEIGPATTDGFWTAAGGVLDIDQGVSTPSFVGDIILRGGKIFTTMSVLATVTTPVFAKITLCFIRQGTNVVDANIASIGSRPWGWDLSDEPDVATSGVSILRSWTAVLNTQQPTFAVEHKLKPRKIDQNWYLTNSTNSFNTGQFLFVYHVVNNTSNAAVTWNVTAGHNLSFSGDASNV